MSAHWGRLGSDDAQPAACTFEGCINPVHGRGLCTAHLQQLYRGQQLRPLRQTRKVCDFPGCDRPHHSRGYCDAHYTQRKRGHELTPIGTTAGRKPARQTDLAPQGRPRTRKPAKMPAGWERTTKPRQPKPATAVSVMIPPVTPTAPEVLAAARLTLARHSADDLAVMLGLAEAVEELGEAA